MTVGYIVCRVAVEVVILTISQWKIQVLVFSCFVHKDQQVCKSFVRSIHFVPVPWVCSMHALCLFIPVSRCRISYIRILFSFRENFLQSSVPKASLMQRLWRVLWVTLAFSWLLSGFLGFPNSKNIRMLSFCSLDWGLFFGLACLALLVWLLEHRSMTSGGRATSQTERERENS